MIMCVIMCDYARHCPSCWGASYLLGQKVQICFVVVDHINDRARISLGSAWEISSARSGIQDQTYWEMCSSILSANDFPSFNDATGPTELPGIGTAVLFYASLCELSRGENIKTKPKHSFDIWLLGLFLDKKSWGTLTKFKVTIRSIFPVEWRKSPYFISLNIVLF